MQLKRWESPRRQGRNSQGKGGAARMRQMKKQQQVLRRKLKGDNGKGTSVLFPYFLGKLYERRSPLKPAGICYFWRSKNRL
ncbi:MAG: hypothetical protein GDA48_22585 [Hormoscilla sp. GM102CHS1]|nr:hypothetical protein [Hormoscilla sp. GM102CHS1]